MNTKEMIFNKKMLKHSFNIKYNFSYIKIKKIMLKSHFNTENNIWAPILSNTILIVKQFITEKNDPQTEYKETKSFQIDLMQFLSLDHRLPLLEVSFEIPSKIIRDNFNNYNFYDRIDFEIKINNNTSDFEYVIYYEKTPGIHEIEKNS